MKFRGISLESVGAILRKDFGPRSNHLEILHLKPEDLERRVNCCLRFLVFIFPEKLPYFFMPDESRFFLDGHIASHNCIIWASKRNRTTDHCVEVLLNACNLRGWCVIPSAAFIGPFFFDGNVNGNACLKLLTLRLMLGLETVGRRDSTRYFHAE